MFHFLGSHLPTNKTTTITKAPPSNRKKLPTFWTFWIIGLNVGSLPCFEVQRLTCWVAQRGSIALAKARVTACGNDRPFATYTPLRPERRRDQSPHCLPWNTSKVERLRRTTANSFTASSSHVGGVQQQDDAERNHCLPQTFSLLVQGQCRAYLTVLPPYLQHCRRGIHPG